MERWTQLNTTLLAKLKIPFHPMEGLRPALLAQRLRMKEQFSPPRVLPKEWFQVSNASAKMEFCMVMLTVGNLSSAAFPVLSLYMCRYMLMFSSRPQLADTWSIMILPTGLPPIASSLLPTHVSPLLNRMKRITTSWVLIQTLSPATQMPSPGAD